MQLITATELADKLNLSKNRLLILARAGRVTKAHNLKTFWVFEHDAEIIRLNKGETK